MPAANLVAPLRRFLALVVALTACAQAGTVSTTVTTDRVAETTATTAISEQCSSDGFSEGGQVAEILSPGADSQGLAAITWSDHAGCEFIKMSFVTSEGAPATTPPPVDVSYLGSSPVIRIGLGVATSAIREQLVESDMVDRLFVVRGIDGSLYVDLHISAPVKALVTTTGSPAAISLELQPGLIDYPTTPLATDRLVVLNPPDGSTVTSPLSVTGYTKEHPAGVVVIATSGDLVLGEHQIEPAADLRAWSEFRTELALDDGPVNLFVGDEQSGAGLEGVTITVTVG